MAEQRPPNSQVGGSIPSRRAKFNNVKTNGYASKKEAKRAVQLKHLEAAGLIRNLREQVKFVLLPKQEGERAVTYTADFAYEEGPLWTPIIEDCKGYPDQKWPIKRKLMLILFGIRVRET